MFGQICVEPHSHEHIVELYIASSEHAGIDVATEHDIDCDVYISARHALPSESNWDFKSNNRGSDHIKLPLYLDDFKDSRGSILIGIYGQGPDINHCTFTLKVNTLENEELLHKFNLRRGQVLLPRDVQARGKKKR